MCGVFIRYGQTKLFGEQICQDVAQSWKMAGKEGVSILSLRYGNPVNCHESGLLPETPVGAAMNLFNVISEVLSGKRDKMSVFGNDYPTPDGTGVRDFIHVSDLADAHVAAVSKLFSCHTGPTGLTSPSGQKDAYDGYDVVNVGIGKGYSVLEMVETMEKIHGIKVPFEMHPRRPGDVASVVFDVSKSERVLNGWKAKRTSLQNALLKKVQSKLN